MIEDLANILGSSQHKFTELIFYPTKRLQNLLPFFQAIAKNTIIKKLMFNLLMLSPKDLSELGKCVAENRTITDFAFNFTRMNAE